MHTPLVAVSEQGGRRLIRLGVTVDRHPFALRAIENRIRELRPGLKWTIPWSAQTYPLARPALDARTAHNDRPRSAT
jgi:hypothetical protein